MKLPKNLKLKKTTLAGLILLLSLSLILGTKALAQEVQRTFTLVNPSIGYKLNPGESTEGVTKIINDGTTPLTFNVGVQDFIVSDTLGTPNLLPSGTYNPKYSGSAWIGITPATFTVNPGEKQVLNYFIHVPQDARPGGHYSAIVYTPVVDKKVVGTGGTINAQIGSIFYLTVNGIIKENSVVSKFFANRFQEYGPVKISTQIQNFGDVHIKPKGTIQVTGLFFNKTEDLPSYNVFPGAARDFENTFGQTFMFGRYKAQLLASYGANNNLPLSASLYFWVIPWRLILVVILVAIAVTLGTLYFKKRKKQKSKEHDLEKDEEATTEVNKSTPKTNTP